MVKHRAEGEGETEWVSEWVKEQWERGEPVRLAALTPSLSLFASPFIKLLTHKAPIPPPACPWLFGTGRELQP